MKGELVVNPATSTTSGEVTHIEVQNNTPGGIPRDQ
jgi:hypothetical protein